MECIHEVLARELKTLNIPYINKGGCGWFAINLIRALDKLGIHAQLYAFIASYDNFTEYKNNNSVDILQNVGLDHVMVCIDDRLYDGVGERKWSEKHWFGVRDKIEKQDLENALEYCAWNSMFDTDHIPRIKKFCNKLVTKYKDKVKQN